MKKGDGSEGKELVPVIGKDLPANMAMYEGDGGLGFEDAGRESYAIPFLRILQQLSPQCKKSEPEYIKGAEEGDFFNTVTGEVFPNEKGGIKFVPAYYIRKFNLWEPRGSGGGFKGSLSSADGEALLLQCTRNDKNQDITPDGLILMDTREHYGLTVDEEGNFRPVLLPLSSTQIKESKKWMTLAQGIQLPNRQPAPMFSQIYQLTTISKSNEEGSWAVLKVDLIGWVQDQELYSAAKQFREMVKSGAAKPVAEGNSESGDLAEEAKCGF